MGEKKKYDVTVNSKVGTCDNALFEKMAKKGDITAIKLSDLIGKTVHITGYADCTIETEEKTFNISYYDTEEYGLFSSGSEIFAESVSDYFGDVEMVRLKEVKTKKGKTYKAVPVLEETKNNREETTKKEETTVIQNDDLPF